MILQVVSWCARQATTQSKEGYCDLLGISTLAVPL